MPSKNLGRIIGKSAYEIAVEKGYVGTETQWLASLKGSDPSRIQWITQSEYSALQFNNQLNPLVEYHITDRPTAYSLQLVGNELQMIINGSTVARCTIK